MAKKGSIFDDLKGSQAVHGSAVTNTNTSTEFSVKLDLEFIQQPLTYGQIQSAILLWGRNTSYAKMWLDFGRAKRNGRPEFIIDLERLCYLSRDDDALNELAIQQLHKILKDRDERESLSQKNPKSLCSQIAAKLARVSNYNQAKNLLSSMEIRNENLSKVSTKERKNFLGGGSYGQVYLGKYQQQNVAHKFLTSNNYYEFIQEVGCHFSAAKKSEYVVKVFAFDAMRHSFIQELGDGGNLEQRITQENFSEHDRLQTAYQITSAVYSIHQAHIVHLDLNPKNIIFINNVAKLTDFGLAIQFPDEKMLAGDLLLKPRGTPGFFAPEMSWFKKTDQADPEQRLAAKRFNRKIPLKHADIYSLGVVFWALAERKAYLVDPSNSQSLRRYLQLFASPDYSLPPVADDKKQNPLYISYANCTHRQPEQRQSIGELHQFFQNQMTQKTISREQTEIKSIGMSK